MRRDPQPTVELSRPDPRPAAILGRARLRRRAALQHRGRRRHASTRRPSCACSVPSRGTSAYVEPSRAARRRPLRREPEPAAAHYPVPGDPQAGAGRRPGALPRVAGRDSASTSRAHDVRFVEDDWESPDARRLGPRLGGLAATAWRSPSSPTSSRPAASTSTRCPASSPTASSGSRCTCRTSTTSTTLDCNGKGVDLRRDLHAGRGRVLDATTSRQPTRRLFRHFDDDEAECKRCSRARRRSCCRPTTLHEGAPPVQRARRARRDQRHRARSASSAACARSRGPRRGRGCARAAASPPSRRPEARGGAAAVDAAARKRSAGAPAGTRGPPRILRQAASAGALDETPRLPRHQAERAAPRRAAPPRGRCARARRPPARRRGRVVVGPRGRRAAQRRRRRLRQARAGVTGSPRSRSASREARQEGPTSRARAPGQGPTPSVLVPRCSRDRWQRFPWPKSMRWGADRDALRAPAALDRRACSAARSCRCASAALHRGRATRGHRFLAPAAARARGAEDYVDAAPRPTSVDGAERPQDDRRAGLRGSSARRRACALRDDGAARRGHQPGRVPGRGERRLRRRLPRGARGGHRHRDAHPPALLRDARTRTASWHRISS